MIINYFSHHFFLLASKYFVFLLLEMMETSEIIVLIPVVKFVFRPFNSPEMMFVV